MSAQDEAACREAFEDWFFAKQPREREGHSYKLMSANSAWQAWQAAWVVSAARAKAVEA